MSAPIQDASDESQPNNEIDEVTLDMLDQLKVTDSQGSGGSGNDANEVQPDAQGNVVYGIFVDTYAQENPDSYPLLQKSPGLVVERQLTEEDIHLKCSEIRWVHCNHKDLMWFPFNGRDSLLIEIRHRLDNDIKLDHESELILNALLKDLKEENEELKAAGCKRQISTSSSEGGHSDKDGEIGKKKIVPVLNNTYKINHDNTKARAIYWKNDSKEIRRGMYFTTDNQPIDPKDADLIQKHVKDHVNSPSPAQTTDKRSHQIPSNLQIDDSIYEWTSIFQFTVQRNNNNPTPLDIYSEEADWQDTYPRVQHLVFVVHGIGHDGNEDGVVECAKLLTEGVDAAANKSSGILFLPVHWRTLIGTDEGVSLEDSKPEINFGQLSKPFLKYGMLADVNLYNSPHYGRKIRNVVVGKLNKLYKKFKSINQTFHGTVSLFGHSLGSVICYDILTNYTKYKEEEGLTPDKSPIVTLEFPVDKLFTVGSPLCMFLEQRKGSSHEKFLKTVNSLRIYNIYHPTDIVSRRLEPFADVMYQVMPPAEILVPNGIISRSPTLVICKTFAKTLWIPVKWAYSYYKGSTRISIGTELPYRLDHKLQKNVLWSEIQSHSIYWHHIGFHMFMVNSLRKKEKHIVFKKQVSLAADVELVPQQNIQSSNPEPSFILITTTYRKKRRAMKRYKIHAVHRRRRTVVTKELHKNPDSNHHKAAILRQWKLAQWFRENQLRKKILSKRAAIKKEIKIN